MDASPFARLSAELRNAIWELALTQPRPVTVTEQDIKRHNSTKPSRSSNPLALAQTCKQINNECGRLFYIHNSFELRGTGLQDLERGDFVDVAQFRKAGTHMVRRTLDLFLDFQNAVGSDNAAVIGDVTTSLGTLSEALARRPRVIVRWMVNVLLEALQVLEQDLPQWQFEVIFDLQIAEEGYATYGGALDYDKANQKVTVNFKVDSTLNALKEVVLKVNIWAEETCADTGYGYMDVATELR